MIAWLRKQLYRWRLLRRPPVVFAAALTDGVNYLPFESCPLWDDGIGRCFTIRCNGVRPTKLIISDRCTNELIVEQLFIDNDAQLFGHGSPVPATMFSETCNAPFADFNFGCVIHLIVRRKDAAE